MAVDLERLKCHRRQRDVEKCDGNTEVELRVRLGGIEEEVKDTMNVFGRLTTWSQLRLRVERWFR